jgi:hypothetical protein
MDELDACGFTCVIKLLKSLMNEAFDYSEL